MRRIFMHDQGTAKEQEDGVVNTHPIVGVLDGVSKPYGPTEPPLILDSMSSGAWAVRTIETLISNMVLNGDCPEILDAVIRVNQSLGNSLVARCGNLPSELRPGATFALAKVDDFLVQAAQTGDSFAFVREKNGRVLFSPYRMRSFEEEDRGLYTSFMSEAVLKLFGREPVSLSEKERGEVRSEFWKLYLPEWVQLKKTAVNKVNSPIGFGLMNGEPEMLSFVWVQKFNRRDVDLVLCLTDGMIPKSVLKKEDDGEIAASVLKIYDRGGLNALLGQVRREEKRKGPMSYIEHTEATGYALEF